MLPAGAPPPARPGTTRAGRARDFLSHFDIHFVGLVVDCDLQLHVDPSADAISVSSRCEACTDTRPCCAHADELIRRTWRTCARLPRNAATAAAMTASVSSLIASSEGARGAAATRLRGGSTGAGGCSRVH